MTDTTGQFPHLFGNPRYEVQIDRDLRARTIDIQIYAEDNTRSMVFAPVVVTILNESDAGQRLRPCMSIPYTLAERLMDELWRTGIRPTDALGSAGQLQAIQEHLRDMRKYLDHHLGITTGVQS
jgi:hypothetical protein